MFAGAAFRLTFASALLPAAGWSPTQIGKSNHIALQMSYRLPIATVSFFISFYIIL